MSAEPPDVHPTAIIDAGADVGSSIRIWHWTHISAKTQIRQNCSIGQNVCVAQSVKIGDSCKIQNNVSVYEGVILEENVFCGPSTVFTNVHNPGSGVVRKAEYLRTLVRRGATLGANCTIICGFKIGECAFVGAGAVVYP